MKHSTWILRSLITAVLTFGLNGLAAAFDHLEITVVNPHLVQGRPAVTVQSSFSVQVRAVNGDGSTDTAADFINATLSSPDVAADLPAGAYLQNGERQFDGLRLLAAGRPVRLRVRDADDPSVPVAEVLIDCYDPVDRFTVTVPAGTKYVDTPIAVTLTALDAGGGAVLNFRDDVTLTAAVGHFSSGATITVAGSSFVEGEAGLPVTFWGTDPVTRENQLTATGTVVYPGQAQPAQGQATVAPLLPGPLATVVLLLAGEQLTPGVSPGKTGTPSSQTSGTTFGGVSVHATDQHWNPVQAGPYPSIAWSSDDPDAGVVLPAAAPMVDNPETGYTLRLMRAGTTRVTATATGAVAATSRSDVVINPEGLSYFEFDTGVWNPGDTQVTTIPFNIRIIARDANGNVFPLNGQVSLRARIGAADESADYIITSNSTFINGQLDALVQVTKRGFSAYIIVDSGVVGVSPAFQVTNGPCEKILITLPGETWVYGQNDPDYSHNGLPDAQTAGDVITPVTLRPVDRYNNLAPGNRNVTISCPTGYFQLPDHPGNIVQISNPTEIRAILRTASSAQVLRAQSSGLDASQSSPITVSPASWQRLVVRAPGETLAPGIFDSIEDDGKIGDPTVQDAGVPFNVRIYATDAYWNPISDSSPALPMAIDFSSSDGAAQLPGNPQQLNDNLGDFQVALVTLADPNRQTVAVADRGTGRNASTTIPVKAGVIDHFDIGINNRSNPTPNDVLSPLPDHRAGSSLPNVTVIARDIFGNHINDYAGSVTLFVNHGTGILTPTSVDLGLGLGSGGYQGAWRGPIQITRTGQDVRLFVREETYALTDSSNAFDVFADAQDYADLLLLLPGETHTPGIAPGKAGTPLPVAAGEPVQARVLATDAWHNAVPARPQVSFTSSSFFQMISPNNQALGPDGSGDFDLYFKTAATHELRAADLIQPLVFDASTIAVTAGEFSRLMLLLPGETPQPGGPEPDGKTGSPLAQTASLEFDARIRGTDQFWNLVTTATERVRLASDDGSLSPTNPLNNDQPLVDGEIIMPIFLTSPGYVTLAATAIDHTDITGQSAVLAVEQGASYLIETPATAAVGPPSTFTVTVSLVDEHGDPLPAANNWITLTALKSNLEPASSTLQIASAQLSGGTVTIADQAYDTVEDIVLRITDVSGRQQYSSTIAMQPNGLEYVVTVDAQQVRRVGPPATFPVTVRLRDTDTQTLIRQDRRLTVGVDAATGGAGQGVVGVTSQRLDQGSVTFQQSYTRAENIYVTVVDSTGLAGASPVFALAADGYKRLQIVAPGEAVQAGIPAFEATGKDGAPLVQRSGEVFPMTVRAVDQYWNLADTTSVGRLRLVASDGSFSAAGNPEENFVPFVNGRRTFNGYLTDEGTVGVSIYDEDDLDKPSQTVYIPVDPPYAYELTVPAQASTGPVPGFQVTVKLVDPVTGNVVPTAHNRFRLTALRPNQGAAGGVLGIDEAQLIGGVCVLNTQSYSTVENIIIRVDDDYGREAFSGVIAMVSGGLYYAVTLPDTAVVGPPTTFPLTVELLDSNTGERVTTQDRLFDIQVLSAQTGLPGVGHLEVAQGILEGGYRLISQAYSRAEDVFVRVSDADGITGLSNTCRLTADGFKRLQIVAPGEEPRPGGLSGSGKTGAPLTQQAEVPFTLTVRAVDQFWNRVHTIDDGAIALAASGGELDLVDAADQGAPFIGGSREIDVVLGNPGLVAVFATDPAHPTVSSGRVDIPVNEAEYRVILPDPPVVTAGPPATFALTVRLVNPETEERIQAGGAFELTALKPDRSAASAALGVGTGTLVAGEAVIGGQHYPASEELVIRVRDSRGRTAYSDVLTVVPEGVRYDLAVPDTVIAGEPFAMQVRRVDIVTGQIVTNDDRSFVLTAFSGDARRPDPALTPAGVLADTVGTTSGGERAFPYQRYDRAESIYLRVSDATGERHFSDVIVVRPAPVSVCVLTAELPAGQALARALRPAERVTLRVRAHDASGNTVAGTPLAVELLAGDAGLGSLRAASADLIADVDGMAVCELSVNAHGARDLLLQARAGDVLSPPLAIEVLGPPVTTPRFAPEVAAYGDGYYVLPTTEISLQATVEGPEPVQGIWFDLDVTDDPRPRRLYTGPFRLADLDPDHQGTGRRTLRFFAEEAGGVSEAVKTVVLVTAAGLGADRDISNRPNPFRAGRESTLILFRPAASGPVTLTIYDLYGGVVLNERLAVTAGEETTYTWDGRNGQGHVVGNGGYICRIHGAGLDLRRKIAVVK